MKSVSALLEKFSQLVDTQSKSFEGSGQGEDYQMDGKDVEQYKITR